MVKLRCMDYGFECDYTIEGPESLVVERFRDHMDSEHGIDYSREAIVQFVRRKQGPRLKGQDASAART